MPPSAPSLVRHPPTLPPQAQTDQAAGLIQSNPTLNESLSTARNITILAPSNEAFSTFLNASSAAPSTDVVAALLSYHVLNGTYPSSSVTNTSTIIPTLLNNSTYTNVTGGQVVSAITNGSDVVITSGGLNHSRIGPMDLTFDGGVVHVIDKVLSIPANVSATAVAANLTGIASALTNASLVATVDGLSDVTIFAPSNAAFRSIGNILANTSAEDLATILTYHVVQGTVGYSSILTNSTLTTVNGGNVTITVTDDGVFVNSARVAIPDVLVSNGVVHVIDAFVSPSFNPPPSPSPHIAMISVC